MSNLRRSKVCLKKMVKAPIWSGLGRPGRPNVDRPGATESPVRLAFNKGTRLLLGLILFLASSACSGLITIELVPTPVPAAAELVLTPEADGDTGRGIPVRIQDDVSGLDAPIVEMSWRLEQRGDELVSEWVVPDNESGWHRNSARPGERSNIVISGHNSSSGGQVFGHLDEVAAGSRLTIWTDTGDTFDYQVTDKQIVRIFGATQETLAYLQQVMQPTDTERLTLITCWPSWTNTHRLIVIAEPL